MLKARAALLVSALIVACLTATGHAQAPHSAKLNPPARPVRAAQVLTLGCDDWEQVDRRLAELKAANVQAVIFRVFHNPGDSYYGFVKSEIKSGVYFKTDHAPVVADVLGKFCELAHKHKLAAIAWMTSRYANYGHENEHDLRCMAWDFGKGKAILAKGYSPLLPEARTRIVRLYQDLANYPIDGVLIQDDLILKHAEGFNPRVRQLYKKQTGRSADPSRFFKKVTKKGERHVVGEYTAAYQKWRTWQNRELIGLAEKIRRTVQAKRPGAPVGVNMYYEALINNKYAMAWFAQDVDATFSSELDFYAFMVYHRQMQNELQLSRSQVFDLIDLSLAGLVDKADHKQRIWIKLQTIDWDNGARVPSKELAELMDRVVRHGPVGLVVVPVKRSLDLGLVGEQFLITEKQR